MKKKKETRARKKETRPRNRMKPTLEDLAVEVLQQNKTPMHYLKVMDRVITLHPITGEKPQNTFYSVVYRSKKIERLGNGMVKLKNV